MSGRLRTFWCAWSERLEVEPIGSLTEATLEALIKHAEECEACRARLDADADAGDDALLDAIRDADSERAEASIDVAPPLSRLNGMLTDYEILGELGRGGMGVVYRARQLSLDRIVALKVLPALIGVVRPSAAARFRREAALAARLKHTNIIGVHDFGEAEGTLYYTMELVEGRTLRDLLDELRQAGAGDAALCRFGSWGSDGSRGSSRDSTRAYFRRAALWAADVASALQYAHERDVLHRDIKPSNLLVNADGRIMISDFGLARPVLDASITAPQALMGTLRYMGPERIDPTFGPVDARTDVYCLGATLYELLTLRPVFDADDDRALLRRILRDQPARPSSIVRQIPPELETICLKALAKRPAERYQTARAMDEDLRRWLLGLPIMARRPSLPVRAAKYVRRRKAASALLCASVILGSAAAYLGWSAAGSAQRERIAEASAQAKRFELLESKTHEAIADGRFADAIRLCDEAARLAPGSPAVMRDHAWALRLMGRIDEAEKVFDSVLETHPDDAATHYRLAMLHHDHEPDGRDPVNRSERAAHHFAEVLRLAPDSDMAPLARSALAPDRTEALAILEKADDRNGARIERLLHRVRLLRALGRGDEALAVAQHAVLMRPRWAVTHFTAGSVLLDLQRHPEAAHAITKAVEMAPDNARHWHNRSIARSGAGDFDGAIADAMRALDIDPGLTRAYFALARAKAQRGQFEAALADLNVAVLRNPEFTEGYIERAHLHHVLGDFEAVAADAARMIQIDPTDARGYQIRSIALAHLGRHERALRDARRCVELQPGAVAHHTNLAAMLNRMDLHAEAVGAYTKAIELDPLDWRYIHLRGLSHLRSGRPERAAADLTRAEELNPDIAEAALLRALAYWELGLLELAVDDLHGVADAQKTPIRCYALMLSHLVLLELGRESQAKSSVAPESIPDNGSWESMLAAALRGEMDEEELLAEAATEDERAEALYYLGASAVLGDRRDAGRRRLEECVAMERVGVLETLAAESMLRRLDAREDDAASRQADADFRR